eukprot:gene22259-29329_t
MGGRDSERTQVLHKQLAVRELYKEANVQLNWGSVKRVGAGLQNLGNTCFMNSVLQALTHTAPLSEAFQSQGEFGSGKDVIAITQNHIKKALAGGGRIVNPSQHAQSLRVINKRFRLGRQEDSHEYLRCLLDAMHETLLKSAKLIRCEEGVKYKSSKYDPFLDLSLEITRASTLRRALTHFTAAEVLDGPNKYRCPKTNKLVKAVKQITVEEPPNVLTIHLKRFEFGSSGSKINKHVEFDTHLDLGPYMSPSSNTVETAKSKQGHMYDLYAVLVHIGHSVHSGHYMCYVSERQVLAQKAYILFYIRRTPRQLPGVPARAPAAATPPAAKLPKPEAGPEAAMVAQKKAKLVVAKPDASAGAKPNVSPGAGAKPDGSAASVGTIKVLRRSVPTDGAEAGEKDSGLTPASRRSAGEVGSSGAEVAEEGSQQQGLKRMGGEAPPSDAGGEESPRSAKLLKPRRRGLDLLATPHSQKRMRLLQMHCLMQCSNSSRRSLLLSNGMLKPSSAMKRACKSRSGSPPSPDLGGAPLGSARKLAHLAYFRESEGGSDLENSTVAASPELPSRLGKRSGGVSREVSEQAQHLRQRMRRETVEAETADGVGGELGMLKAHANAEKKRKRKAEAETADDDGGVLHKPSALAQAEKAGKRKKEVSGGTKQREVVAQKSPASADAAAFVSVAHTASVVGQAVDSGKPPASSSGGKVAEGAGTGAGALSVSAATPKLAKELKARQAAPLEVLHGKDALRALNFGRGAGQNSTWDGVVPGLAPTLGGSGFKKKEDLDEWDAEYDVGKVKKGGLGGGAGVRKRGDLVEWDAEYDVGKVKKEEEVAGMVVGAVEVVEEDLQEEVGGGMVGEEGAEEVAGGDLLEGAGEKGGGDFRVGAEEKEGEDFRAEVVGGEVEVLAGGVEVSVGVEGTEGGEGAVEGMEGGEGAVGGMVGGEGEVSVGVGGEGGVVAPEGGALRAAGGVVLGGGAEVVGALEDAREGAPVCVGGAGLSVCWKSYDSFKVKDPAWIAVLGKAETCRQVQTVAWDQECDGSPCSATRL